MGKLTVSYEGDKIINTSQDGSFTLMTKDKVLTGNVGVDFTAGGTNVAVACGSFTPAENTNTFSVDVGMEFDKFLLALSPTSAASPLNNGIRVSYGGFWDKTAGKRRLHIYSNAAGGSWTGVAADSTWTAPSGTIMSETLNYLVAGVTYNWYAW